MISFIAAEAESKGQFEDAVRLYDLAQVSSSLEKHRSLKSCSMFLETQQSVGTVVPLNGRGRLCPFSSSLRPPSAPKSQYFNCRKARLKTVPD